MPSMDFDAALAAEEREPVTFTVRGQQFHAVPGDELPWTAGMRLVEAPEEGPEAIRAIGRFINEALVPEDQGRWAELFEQLSASAIKSLMEWLSEVYAGRPTGQPSTSANGSEPTGPGARVVRLWAPADQQPAVSTG